MSEVSDIARTSNIKANTEALITPAQEQTLNTRAVIHEMYHTVQDPRCRLYKQHEETVAHITSGCSKLAGTEYTERHNNMASIVYRAICAEYNFEHSKDWWVEQEKVVRNGHAKTSGVFPFRRTSICFTIGLISC